MMNKLLVLIAVLSLAYCQDGKSGDLDAVIKQIFGEPPSSPSPNTPSTIVPPVTQPATTDKPLSCKMDDSSTGECVRYYLCNANNSVITDGVGIIDIRVQDGPCPSYLDVCCSLPDTRKPEDPITPPPPVEQQVSYNSLKNNDQSNCKSGDLGQKSHFLSKVPANFLSIKQGSGEKFADRTQRGTQTSTDLPITRSTPNPVIPSAQATTFVQDVCRYLYPTF